jgi:hypothetical protein
VVDVKATLNRDEVIQLLKARQGKRSVSALAVEFGISLAYLSDAMKGKRSLGPAILQPLGLIAETQTVYRRAA